MKRKELLDFKEILTEWGFYVPTDMYECIMDQYLKINNPIQKQTEFCTCHVGSMPIPKVVIDICTRCNKKIR